MSYHLYSLHQDEAVDQASGAAQNVSSLAKWLESKADLKLFPSGQYFNSLRPWFSSLVKICHCTAPQTGLEGLFIGFARPFC